MKQHNEQAGPPIVGGLDLSKLKNPPLPHTSHVTTFRSCHVSFVPVVDEDLIVREYQLVIKDVLEHRVYTFTFDQKLKDMMVEMLQSIPGVGFPMERGEPDA